MNFPGSRPVPAFSATLVVLFAVLVLLSGCTKSPSQSNKSDKAGEGPKVDPWETVAKRLRKETDVAAVKAALGQLTSDLAARPDVPGPAALSPEAEKALAAVVPLAPSDAENLHPAVYTGQDAAYIADCFYLRDAARSLAPSTLPPSELARLGFAWVCRQVYLNPWLREIQPGVLQATALPPTAVLRRGYGSGLERAYVFLALLQQMGIDGCLIGPPAAVEQFSGFIAKGADGKVLTGSPKGPFWAVGARVGADVVLFDPWRGLPFPGPDGKGVGTLAQVKANPDQIKAWLADANWGVTPEVVKQANVFLAAPVSSLSPRIALLDDKLKADVGVVLAVQPAVLRDRFLAAAPAGPGLPSSDVRFWNPIGDEFAYGRTLASFLPAEEGGTDRASLPHRLNTLYMRFLLPQSIISIPRELTPQPAIDRLVSNGVTTYANAFFTPPSPRERMQRGQLQDAARYLSDKQDGFIRGLERMKTATSAEISGWCKMANNVYAELHRAQYPDPLQSQPQPDSDPAVAAARNAVEEFWKAHAQTAQVIIDQASARLGLAEATFLLALAKHEEAERQQLRAEQATAQASARAKAAAEDAWREAKNAWDSYRVQSASLPPPGFPGRDEQVKALLARAEKMAPPPPN